MKLLFPAVVFFCFSLSACNSLSNATDELLLRCGSEVKEGFKFVTIDDWTDERFEAVYLDANAPISLNVNDKGCVEVPTNATGELLVRSEQAGLRLDLNESPLKKLLLLDTPKDQLQRQELIYSCKDEVTSNLVDLKLDLQESDRFHYYSHRYELWDKQAMVASGKISSGSLDLDTLGISEGSYELRLFSEDGFELGKQIDSQIRSCSVRFDKSAPVVSTSLSSLADYQEGIKLLFQDGNYSFEILDESQTQLYSCLRRRFSASPRECLIQDFMPSRTSFVAPNEGIWDIDYFVEDEAGNRSEISRTSFAVFKDRSIESTKRALATVKSSALLRENVQSLDLLKLAISEFNQLTLEGEQEALKADLTLAASEVDSQIFLTSQLDLNSKILRLVSGRNERDIGVFLENDEFIWVSQGEMKWRSFGIIDAIFPNKSSLFLLTEMGQLLQLDEKLDERVILEFDSALTTVKYGLKAKLRVSSDEKWIAILGAEESQVFTKSSTGYQLALSRAYRAQSGNFRSELIFSKDEKHAALKYGSFLSWLSLKEGQIELVEHPRDPRCGITSLVITDNFSLVYMNASVATREIFDEPEAYVACPGINMWNPKTNTRRNLTLEYDLQHTKEATLAYTSFPESSFFIFDFGESYLSRVGIDSENNLYPLAYHKFADERPISGFYLSDLSRYLVLESSKGFDVQLLSPSYKYPSEEFSASRFIAKRPVTDYEASLQDSSSLVVASNAKLSWFSLEDSLYGRRVLHTMELQREQLIGEDIFADFDSKPILLSKNPKNNLLASYRLLDKSIEIFNDSLETLGKYPVDSFVNAMSYYDDVIYFSDFDKKLWKLSPSSGEVSLVSELDSLLESLVAAPSGVYAHAKTREGSLSLLRFNDGESELVIDNVIYAPQITRDQRWGVYLSEIGESYTLHIFDFENESIVLEKSSEGFPSVDRLSLDEYGVYIDEFADMPFYFSFEERLVKDLDFLAGKRPSKLTLAGNVWAYQLGNNLYFKEELSQAKMIFEQIENFFLSESGYLFVQTRQDASLEVYEISSMKLVYKRRVDLDLKEIVNLSDSNFLSLEHTRLIGEFSSIYTTRVILRRISLSISDLEKRLKGISINL